MHICKTCNEEVQKPKRRLWRQYCQSGHRLLRDAVVQSFWGSFARAFGVTFFLLFMGFLFLVMGHGSIPGAAERRDYVKIIFYVFAFLLSIAFLNGFLAYREGRRWQQRGGAVEKLVPRARGRAFGCVWGAGVMAICFLPGLWKLIQP